MERAQPAIRSTSRAVKGPTAAPALSEKPPVELVYVFPLRGWPRTLADSAEAIAFIESFDESKPERPFTRYEVDVRYSNGNEVRGQFNDKLAAVAFLRSIR